MIETLYSYLDIKDIPKDIYYHPLNGDDASNIFSINISRISVIKNIHCVTIFLSIRIFLIECKKKKKRSKDATRQSMERIVGFGGKK